MVNRDVVITVTQNELPDMLNFKSCDRSTLMLYIYCMDIHVNEANISKILTSCTYRVKIFKTAKDGQDTRHCRLLDGETTYVKGCT